MFTLQHGVRAFQREGVSIAVETRGRACVRQLDGYR
jgi:hypothetical protein